MGGCGPFPHQTERWAKERRENEARDSFEGKLPNETRDLVDLISTEDLARFAPLLDREKLVQQRIGLELIAQKFQEIKETLGELAFDTKFNGGLIKTLPAIERWQIGFTEEATRFEKLSNAVPVAKSTKSPRSNARD